MTRRVAAVAAPLIVMLVLLVQGMATPDYDPIRNTISELGSGWRGTGIIAMYGIALVSVVWGSVAKSLPSTVSRMICVAALLAVGVGCIGLAVVAPESWPWDSMTWRGHLHLIFAFVFVFGGIPCACLAASRALPTAWRGLRIYSFVTGLGCFSLLVGTLIALPGSAPGAFAVSHLGLIERVYVFAFLLWQCIVSSRLARVTPT